MLTQCVVLQLTERCLICKIIECASVCANWLCFLTNSKKKLTDSFTQLETQYIISDIFAEGNFAQVRKATKKQSKLDFAMKIIAKSKIQRREQIDNEISIMQR